jgi:hypothetical protein
MWCTQCHTSFSWRDGSRITTTIHNPHAVAWRRQQREEERHIVVQDVDACALPDISLILPSSALLRGGRRDTTGLAAPYRAIAEVTEWLPYLREAITRAGDKFRIYRLRYILGEFNEKTYGHHLYRLAHRVQHVRTYHDIFDTLRTVGLRVFHNIARREKTAVEGLHMLGEVRTFVNNTIKKELPQLGKIDPITVDWVIRYDKRIQSLIT